MKQILNSTHFTGEIYIRNQSVFQCLFLALSALTKAMSPVLDLVQSIFSALSSLTKLMLTCLKLVSHWDASNLRLFRD